MHNILLIEWKDCITPTATQEEKNYKDSPAVQRLLTSILAKVPDDIFLSLNCGLHSKMTQNQKKKVEPELKDGSQGSC